MGVNESRMRTGLRLMIRSPSAAASRLVKRLAIPRMAANTPRLKTSEHNLAPVSTDDTGRLNSAPRKGNRGASSTPRPLRKPVKSSFARACTSMRYRTLSWSSSPVPFLHDRSLGRRKMISRVKMRRPPARKELSVPLDVEGSGSWSVRGGMADMSRRKNPRYRATNSLLIQTWSVSRIPRIMRSFSSGRAWQEPSPRTGQPRRA